MTTPSNVTGFWSGTITYTPFFVTNPLTINIGAGPDSNGISWVWESITGWDSPPTAGSVTQRTADHGGWPGPQYYGPRMITITLDALCPNQYTRDLARALLQQAIPVNDLATFQFNEPIPKVFLARRSGQIVETLPNLTDAIFAIALVAPDPRKYGATLRVSPTQVVTPQQFFTIGLNGGSNSSIGAGVTLPSGTTPATQQITNFGTFETRPLIVVQGPITGPSLVNQLTGQTVSWTNTSMNAGDVLEVDFDARAATLNGLYYPADISSAWWTLWPGPNVIQLGGVCGPAGAQMFVVWRDAYI